MQKRSRESIFRQVTSLLTVKAEKNTAEKKHFTTLHHMPTNEQILQHFSNFASFHKTFSICALHTLLLHVAYHPVTLQTHQTLLFRTHYSTCTVLLQIPSRFHLLLCCLIANFCINLKHSYSSIALRFYGRHIYLSRSK